MGSDPGRLKREELLRLRDAVHDAGQPATAVPRQAILAVHDAAPRDGVLTVDYEASAQLGMPLLIVRVPIGPQPSPALAALTPREFEVAGLVAAGLANKEIAARLGLKLSTVKEYVHRILVKTELPSRAAVANAYVNGGGNTGRAGSDGTSHSRQP
jgi:DNA-binding NarL/FixJ family response regulator